MVWSPEVVATCEGDLGKRPVLSLVLSTAIAVALARGRVLVLYHSTSKYV
jgi:hypothetical protein